MDLECFEILDGSNNGELYLSAILRTDKKPDNNVSILYTVCRGQKRPMCTLCSTKFCRCYQIMKKEIEDNHNPDRTLTFFWDRKLGPTKSPEKHFMADHFEHELEDYGFNHESMEYPIKVNCPTTAL